MTVKNKGEEAGETSDHSADLVCAGEWEGMRRGGGGKLSHGSTVLRKFWPG